MIVQVSEADSRMHTGKSTSRNGSCSEKQPVEGAHVTTQYTCRRVNRFYRSGKQSSDFTFISSGEATLKTVRVTS